jgi:GTP-binding protein LepA
LAIKNIRDFSIIAHIDHGKSTLADRLLEHTGAVLPRQMREQVLDKMDIERERGITIKAKAVRLNYKARDGKDYILNLIDTPGHVDFSYEVSRSLAAGEGALLVIDAAQGIQAQTLANAYLAQENNLTIVPVINKIDLSDADPDSVRNQIRDVLGLEGPILASAKEGIGTDKILEAIVNRIPPPQGDPDERLQVLIFDSSFDPYRGVIVYIRVVQGIIRLKDRIKLMGSGKVFEVSEVGIFVPEMRPANQLMAGEVGYLMANIKDLVHARVGDTITNAKDPSSSSLPGYRKIKPMVFCGLYPARSQDYEGLRSALQKLRLNDSALWYEGDSSTTLGLGFRCGFLGLLHIEICQERLAREYGLNLIATAPSVVYRVIFYDGKSMDIANPTKLPPVNKIKGIQEPYIRAIITAPVQYLGNIMKLAQGRRGVYKDTRYLEKDKISIEYELPLSEVILEFYDRLKSVSRGYASFDYEHIGYRESDPVRVDILLNGKSMDGLCFMVHRDKAYHRAREVTRRLKEVIPKHLFVVTIQANIGRKVIARESIGALRKDVTAKLYGGDVTRKRKLLDKQKKGKRRMKEIGEVRIPQEAFLSLMKVE